MNTTPVSATTANQPVIQVNKNKTPLPANKEQNDNVVISGNKSSEEKSLLQNIKKSLRDGVVFGSISFTAISIINHCKEKISSKNLTAEQKTMCAKLPAKSLAIGIGTISSVASLWTSHTTEKLSEYTKRKWTGLTRRS